MNAYVLTLNDPKATLDVAGGKGASLARLVIGGLPVPDGFHVTTAAYKQFVADNDLGMRTMRIVARASASAPANNGPSPAALEDASREIAALFSEAQMPPEIAGAIAQAYGSLPGQAPAVAVRSSGTAEDLPDLSFAGQQESYLNVHGIPAVLKAVQQCWASLWTARAIGYRVRHGIDQHAVSLAVVVQLLVPAEAAGIMFTANPVTGRRDQAMISAAWGLGEAVVGGMVTPDTLIVDKATGHVVTRDTADKQVMTVRLEDGTEEQPVPEALCRAPVLDDGAAVELVRLGVQIEELYGRPMDVEWASVDGRFAIVQARPITALPEPEAEPPTEWPLPVPKGQYMRASIVDLMPDPLTPLFATLGFDILNDGIRRLTGTIVGGKPGLTGEVLVTINGYAYLVVSYTPREWWWMFSRMLPAFPRMLRTGIPRWRDEVRPAYIETVQRWDAKALDTLPAGELWRGIREVITASVEHLGALMVGTMGASAGSEGLFTVLYDKFARREGDPPAPAFLMGYDSIPIRSEKSLYDLAMWCQEHANVSAHILDTPTNQIVDELRHPAGPEGLDPSEWQGFKERLGGHLRRFGHVVYDLDFGKLLPRDDPAPMLEAVKMSLRGEGSNPHERQRQWEERRNRSTADLLQRLKGLRLRVMRMSLGWAQRQAAVREDGLADIGLGYPVLRAMLRELGRRLVAAGALTEPDDVFWTVRGELEEAVQALDQELPIRTLENQVRVRQAAWRAEKRATPPPQLPPKQRYLGFKTDAFIAAREDEQADGALKGVATSPGVVTAPACVLHGPEDFDRMQSGHVLVAQITTPAWTPLFAMASAVVTDVGGPLSHGSIVAREYGIPAVLGTGVATKRIRSGQVITVDGGEGIVRLADSV